MDRIKNLNRYQSFLLLFMAAAAAVFLVIYAVTISRVGFAYQNHILVPSQKKESTVYSGKIQGKQALFTVSDTQVVFQYGEKTYGPYTAAEDPAAIPKDHELAASMTGVELRQGERVLFRGGVLDTGDYLWLYNEDGSVESFGFHVEINGVALDENGTEIDPMEPSVATILELLTGPQLVHNGDWYAWFGALLICILNAVSMLFAEELFRLSLSLRILNPASAEPSELEIFGRYFSWTAMAILALLVFALGLQ